MAVDFLYKTLFFCLFLYQFQVCKLSFFDHGGGGPPRWMLLEDEEEAPEEEVDIKPTNRLTETVPEFAQETF